MATPMTPSDLKRIAAEVSVQHGIRIDADDPMMAVVTLNRLVFEQAVAEVLERVQLRRCGISRRRQTRSRFVPERPRAGSSQLRRRV